MAIPSKSPSLASIWFGGAQRKTGGAAPPHGAAVAVSMARCRKIPRPYRALQGPPPWRATGKGLAPTARYWPRLHGAMQGISLPRTVGKGLASTVRCWPRLHGALGGWPSSWRAAAKGLTPAALCWPRLHGAPGGRASTPPPIAESSTPSGFANGLNPLPLNSRTSL
jgi:hypothetical protein